MPNNERHSLSARFENFVNLHPREFSAVTAFVTIGLVGLISYVAIHSEISASQLQMNIMAIQTNDFYSDTLTATIEDWKQNVQLLRTVSIISIPVLATIGGLGYSAARNLWRRGSF